MPMPSDTESKLSDLQITDEESGAESDSDDGEKP